MASTQAQRDAAFKAARAWIDAEAGAYASMIPDADVRKLCEVVLAAASSPARSPPAPGTRGDDDTDGED